MNKRRLVVIVVLVAIAVIAVSITVLLLSSPEKLQYGHTEVEGSLEEIAYPNIFDSVPEVMVFVVVPMDDQQRIYLTENGMPISSLEGFEKNDFVKIEGVLYGREVVHGIGTYYMLEIFTISEGD